MKVLPVEEGQGYVRFCTEGGLRESYVTGLNSTQMAQVKNAIQAAYIAGQRDKASQIKGALYMEHWE